MTVYLLKNKSDDTDRSRVDPYEEEIPGVQFVPIMDYHCINLDELRATLASESSYDGIIVTSQRAVDSMKAVLSDVPETVLEKPIYTVGPTTAKRLQTLNFQKVDGFDSGNGIALASSMISTLPHKSRLLFLAGEIHRRQLPDRLTDAGHSVTTKILYRTTPNPEVGSYFQQHLHSGDWIVFFSPSHTAEVLESLRSTDKKYNLAAIGPTTQEFLVNSGFAVKAIASEPTAKGLKHAIEKAETFQS